MIKSNVVRRPPTHIPTIYFNFVRCSILKSPPAAMRAHKPSQLVLRHQTLCQLDVVVIQNLQRLARKVLAACCRLEDLVCWFD